MGKLHPSMQAIIDAVEENEFTTSREIANKLGLEIRQASDKMSSLTRRGFFKASGIKQHRKYMRTAQQPVDKSVAHLNDESFQWHKDPANFQMRAGR